MKDIKIGYLGPEGTFSHQAILSSNEKGEYIPYATFSELLEAVEYDEIDKALVALENSLEGSVNDTLDMLLFEVNLLMEREIILPIHHHLIMRHDYNYEDIKKVLSYKQPIGQCRKYLHKHLKGIERIYTSSSAEAVKKVKKSNEPIAAIGNALAAEIYNLKIVKSNIQDNENNKTRFVMVGKKAIDYTENCKTSIAFSMNDTQKPGELYKVLNIFSVWDLNMTKIVSRPMKNRLGQYAFYVDLEGHREDPDMRDALKMVERKCSFFKVLGSYKVFDEKI